MQLQLHYITQHYTTLITPHHSYNCKCNYTTLITLHHSYNYNCTTPHYIQQLWWGDHCNHCNHSKKHNSQPPFGPSVDSLCHPWFTTTNLSYRLPIFETSATALCGTTTICHHISCWWCTLLWPIPAIPQRSIYLPGFTFQKSNITWHDITGHDMTPHNITYHDMTWHNISFM